MSLRSIGRNGTLNLLAEISDVTGQRLGRTSAATEGFLEESDLKTYRQTYVYRYSMRLPPESGHSAVQFLVTRHATNTRQALQ
jgi:hypothetical protein